MNDPIMQARVVDLYTRYSETLCDLKIADWPEYFTDSCLYRVVSRPNHDRGQRIGPMFAENKGALKDRVVAISETLVYSARSLTHLVSGVRVVSSESSTLRSRSMLAVYQTLIDGTTQLQLVGRSFDVIDASGSELKFHERVVVFDTELLAGALVYPV
ncbi:MAG: aromatic-ring-hydroxylating dioxygenase subunit beta [Hydrogenophaga sp.]|jgi:3-phenylpropionate/cinnamic acid dioxygenase small subunit|nr:aromatic-ring-hydroxylating dioxygenase subunit beta [Hydrogenophaga sp.]